MAFNSRIHAKAIHMKVPENRLLSRIFGYAIELVK